MTQCDSITQLIATVRQLREADRITVLKFALAILNDRIGKREQRRKSHHQRSPIVESWRIGPDCLTEVDESQ